MAKQSASKKKSLKDDKLAWFAAAILVLGFGYYAYNSYIKWNDRHRFEQAQASIDELYTDIVAKVGEPNNYRRSASCSRPNQKFEQGPLSCNVGVEFVYDLNDRSEAESKYESAQSVIKNQNQLFTLTTYDKKLKDVSFNTWLSVSGYGKMIAANGMGCVFKFVFDTPKSTYLDIKGETKGKVFYGTLSCSDLSSVEL